MKYLNSQMIGETKKAKFLPKVWLECIIFTALYLGMNVTQLIVMLLGIVPIIFGAVVNSSFLDNPERVAPVALLLMLFATIGTVAVVFIYTRLIQKRNAVSVGLRKKRGWLSYLFGVGLGAILVVLCYGSMYLSGLITGISVNSDGTIFFFLLFLVAFVLQSFSEEYLCRGHLMNSIAARTGSVTWAVVLNSAIFGLLHIFNSGITLFALFTLALMGGVFSLTALLTDDIWSASGLHFFWNFAITCIAGEGFGGYNVYSLFLIEYSDPTLIDAGFLSLSYSTLFQFGAELLLFGALLALVLLRNARNKKNGQKPLEPMIDPPKPRYVPVYAPGYYYPGYGQPAAAQYYPPQQPQYAPPQPVYYAPQQPQPYPHAPGYAPHPMFGQAPNYWQAPPQPGHPPQAHYYGAPQQHHPQQPNNTYRAPQPYYGAPMPQHQPSNIYRAPQPPGPQQAPAAPPPSSPDSAPAPPTSPSSGTQSAAERPKTVFPAVKTDDEA